jgi:Ca2+-binding EF-hand superfamily protein
MDTNGDGAISRAEWRGSDQSFRVHDWNRDGVLSGAEVREAARQAAAADPGDFDNADAFNDWSVARFNALDRNGDGRLVRAEWPFDVDSFRRADRNRDNVLTQSEFQGGDFDDDRGDRFDFLDLDGNNRLTRNEWHGSAAAFTWLDTDRNGWLSRSEVEGEDAGASADLFNRVDTNRDNRISRTEWRWSRPSFDRLDANGDQVLTRRELAATDVSTTATTASVDVGGTSNETRWADTGLYVYAGDLVRFQSTGTVYMREGEEDAADPGGSRTNRRAADSPLPSQPAGALIGRVENGGPFLIGAQNRAIRMPRTGRLFLSVNDDHLDDNRGAFRVSIQISRAQ